MMRPAILLGMLASITGVFNDGVASAQPSHVLQYIGTEQPERAFDFDVTPDGNFVLAGETLFDDENFVVDYFKPYIVRFDENGDTLWTRMLPENAHAESILALESGDLAVGGTSSNNRNAFVWRTDREGRLKWSVLLPGGSHSNVARAIVELEDRLAVAVVSRDDNFPGGRLRIVSLDADGSVLSDRSVVEGHIELHDMKLTSAGLLIAGRLLENDWIQFVTQLDSALVVVWDHRVNGFDTFAELAVLEDESVVFVTPVPCPDMQGGDLCLVRLGPNATVVSTAGLAISSEYTRFGSTYVRRGNHGDLVIGFGAGRAEHTSAAVLLRTSVDGQIRSMTAVQGIEFYGPRGVADTESGGILTAGQVNGNPGSDFFMARTDAGGAFPSPPTCYRGHAEADLDAGNVRVTIENNGSLLKEGINGPGFEAPKGSGISAVDGAAMWIGGTVDGEIRISGGHLWPEEMWPGPLGADGNVVPDCSAYDRIYEVTNSDVLRYEQSGEASRALADWPADVGAPVIDGDGNPQNYDLEAGDRPWLHGDQTLWWVMNDAGSFHGLTETRPVRVEVQTTAFAGNELCQLRSATGTLHPRFRNSIYYRMRMIYRGDGPLEDAWFAIYFQTGLGEASDDYVGSDSLLSLAYTYNADNYDEQYGYGPPAFGITIINGPMVSRNGTNERLGATRFLDDTQRFFRLRGPEEHYNALRGLWSDGEPTTYGGNGRGFSTTPANFMYPVFPPTYWSEATPYPSGDYSWSGRRHRSMLSTGPFRMEPGDVQEIDIALVWSESLYELRPDVAEIHRAFEAIAAYDVSECETLGQPEELPATYGLGHYPNPVSESAVVRFELPRDEEIVVVLYDLLGRKVAELAKGLYAAGLHQVVLESETLATGLYLYRLEAQTFVGSRPLMIVR